MSQVNYYPPPDIPRPDILYQHVNNGWTDLKYRLNANEVYRPAKALFTIQNLGQNNMALVARVEKTASISDAQKQAISSSNQQRTVVNSSREHETKERISLDPSTTGCILTGSMETKKEITEEPTELFQEPLASSGNDELQQHHASSISSTSFLNSAVSPSTQHQVLDSSYPMNTKQPGAEEYEFHDYKEQLYFTTSDATIIRNPSGSEQQFQAENTMSVTTSIVVQGVPQEAMSSSDIRSKQLPSNFVNNTLFRETKEKQKPRRFSETEEVSKSHYETSIDLSEFYPDLSTNTVSFFSLLTTVEPDIPMNLPVVNTESQGSAIQYSSDIHETSILENTKNSSGIVVVNQNNLSQTGKKLFQPIDITSTVEKQFVKPRNQSLLSFHFSMKNGTIIFNNVSSSKHTSKQETIPRSSAYFGSDTDESNISNNNTTLEETTHEETLVSTAMIFEESPVLGSYHGLSVGEILNVTNEKETLSNFGQETDSLHGRSNFEQHSPLTSRYYPELTSLSNGYYLEEQHLPSDLDTEGIASTEINEQNYQTTDIYLTNIYPSYESREVVEHGEVPDQLGHIDISQQEQIDKMKMSSDLHLSAIDITSTASDITQQSTVVTEMKSEVFNEIYEVKQTESSSTNAEETMPSMLLQITNEIPLSVAIISSTILAGIHRTEIPIKEITDDNHAASMNWYATSSIKLGESRQHVILPISEVKVDDEISDTSGLVSTTQESSEAINISAPTPPAIILLPPSVPLLAVTEISSDGYSTAEEGWQVNPSHIDKESSEDLLEATSSYLEEVSENDWNSQFKSEVPQSKILHNETADEIKNSGTSSYLSNFHEYKNDDDGSVMAIVDKNRQLIRNESPRNTPVTGNQSKISKARNTEKLASISSKDIVSTTFFPIPIMQNRYVSISPGYGTVESTKINEPQFIPQPLPPNSVKFPYTAQPFKPVLYQSYIPQKPFYTSFPKATIHRKESLNAPSSMFDLKKGRECCGGSGQGNGGSGYQSCGGGFVTNCSPYCLLLPCKLIITITLMLDHLEK
ncbi:Uncharacterized protein BM_BM323 [Brugia malayi]|uniref:Bm323 n=1 Tax=Brugia malayi TaxID=6279 RepID=A0A4E9ETJ5_BRUMA|nr:Uncharacterized protein BM_BM323 [Brugia malayi]VIO87383.1 Uncharacterized protein BM_BM323 [Brugia malayi]